MPTKAEPKQLVPIKAEDVDGETGEIFTPTSCELDTDAHVALRWLWVQEHLPAIPKGRQNQQQGFKYRSIDQVLEVVHVLFAKAGVFVLPARQQAQYVEWEGKSGAIHVTRITTDWQIFGAKGDWITAQTVGQGADSFDKGTQKAQTAAFKYLLWPSLSIAENEWDPDAHTPEETVNRPRFTREGVQEGAAALQDRVAQMEQPKPKGPDMATQPQINKVRLQCRDLGYTEEGTEIIEAVNSFGEPGWQGSLSKLEKWQASRLIDYMNQ